MNRVSNKSPTRLVLALLVAVVVLGLALLALRPRKPVYGGKRLSAWLDELGASQAEGESQAAFDLRRRHLTNVVRAIGAEAAATAVRWIREKPSKLSYQDAQYRVESLFRFRIHLPERNDRSGDAIWVFQILGPEAKPAIPDLAELVLSEHTCYEAARCLSMTGPAAVPALSNAVANGTARVRLAAIDARAEIGHSAAPTAPLLQQIIRTNDQTTWKALRALVEVETSTAGLLPVILGYLQDTHPPPSSVYDFGAAPGAAYALAHIGPQGVPALLEALTSTQAVIRASAKAAFEPRFHDMLSGKLPSDFYARSGCYQAAFGRNMISEATAKTLVQLPEAYRRQLRSIADRHAASTNEAVRSAAAALAQRLDALRPSTNAPPAQR